MKILDELERLEKEATPEGWVTVVLNFKEGEILSIGEKTILENKYDSSLSIAASNVGRDIDAKLIVAMRNNLKALMECARALEWYAKNENYEHRLIGMDRAVVPYSQQIIKDGGQRAREALEKLDGEE